MRKSIYISKYYQKTEDGSEYFIIFQINNQTEMMTFRILEF